MASALSAQPEQKLPVETVEEPEEVVEVEAGETPPELTGAVAGEGPVVARVEVRSDAPVERPDELRELISIRPGERLTDRAVRRTLRNVQASGIAYEVELYTRPTERPPPPPDRVGAELDSAPAPQRGADQRSGDHRTPQPADPPARPGEEASSSPTRPVGGEPAVDVILVLRQAVHVSEVQIEGDLGRLARSELEREIDVAPRQPLIESRLLRGVYRLQDLYQRRGYFDASVRLDVDPDEARKRARVVFRIEAGPRARIGAVRFEGDLGPFTPAELRERLRLAPGDPYRREAVQETVERLQGWLVGEDYRTAEVEEPREEVDQDSEEVALTYPVEVGPRVEVEIVGASRKELVRNDLLPFLGDEGYDEALVLQAVDRVTTHFQDNGHWHVAVDWQEERRDGVLHLTLTVEPGPVYTLQEIRFQGNEEISDEQLSALMATTPRRLLTLGSGRLVHAALQDDLENIRSYYALQGFRGYDVGPPEVEERGQDLYVTIPIEEGERRRVVELGFEGVEALSTDELRDEIPLEAGGPFHSILLEDCLQIVRGLYEADGYLSVQVSAREEWNEDRTLVDLAIQVIEGPRTVLDRLIVRGNAKTVTDVIEDAANLEPGEPVSRTRLLEVEQRLYGLGVFSRVQVDLGPADLSEPTRDVIIRVQEGRTQRTSYGVGYDSDDGAAGLFGYSHRNLFGRAFTFQADLRYGERERLVRAVLDQPDFTRYDVPILYTVAAQDEDLPAYDVERFIGQVEAVRQEDEWRYGLALDYRIVNSTLNEDVVADDVIVERRDQDVRISSLIPNLFVDRRNDPIEPTRGWSGTARLQWAFPVGSLTEADFLKTFLQHTRYVELGYGHLAGSLRVGAIEPLADVTEDLPGAVDDEPPNLEIPIDERFFAGGDFSHRAYDRDELGIPGATLFPDGRGRGGNGLFLLNLDYRFPAWGPVGGAVFWDVGNVWPDWRDVDPSDLKSGVGLEVRYVSPIGPVRAGVGYQLDPEPGTADSDRYKLYLAVGNPF